MLTYLRNLFIALDQLVNASCGGNPEVTISARTGYLLMSHSLNLSFGGYFLNASLILHLNLLMGQGTVLKRIRKKMM